MLSYEQIDCKTGPWANILLKYETSYLTNFDAVLYLDRTMLGHRYCTHNTKNIENAANKILALNSIWQ